MNLFGDTRAGLLCPQPAHDMGIDPIFNQGDGCGTSTEPVDQFAGEFIGDQATACGQLNEADFAIARQVSYHWRPPVRWARSEISLPSIARA